MKRAKKWDRQEMQELFEAILKLKTTNECRRFFRDLCTPDELVDMTDRFQVVKMLVRKIDYRDIAGRLGMSTTTVARVAHWLYQGMGGYKLILNRLGLLK
ncbi:MAG: YerC/YecD family TrpR-related protein [Patescibacteria group bacterium]